MSFKRAKVIMLPTKEKAPLLLIGDWNRLQLSSDLSMTPNDVFDKDESYEHLYIVSNDEIKEGDWCIIDDGEVIKWNYQKYRHYLDLICKKVIATTDLLLGKPFSKDGMLQSQRLSQPSQAFVEKYVEQYNKGNQIVDVLVEYELDIDYHGDNPDKDYKLKINSKDKTITIKKVKDSWNREEVYKLIMKYALDMHDVVSSPNLNKWIEQNL